MLRKKVMVVGVCVTLGLAALALYFWEARSTECNDPARFACITSKIEFVGDPNTNNFAMDLPKRGEFTFKGDFNSYPATQHPVITSLERRVGSRLKISQNKDDNGPFVLFEIFDAQGQRSIYYRYTDANITTFTNWADVLKDALAANNRVVNPPGFLTWISQAQNRDSLVALLTAIAAVLTAIGTILSAFTKKKDKNE